MRRNSLTRLVPCALIAACLAATSAAAGVAVVAVGGPQDDKPAPTLSAAEVLKLPKIEFPSASDAGLDGASCDAARQRLPQWLAEIEPEIDPAVRAACEQHVAGRQAIESKAEAWDELGVSMLLQGDALAAAWCGLNALKIEWSATILANTGIAFIYLDRPPHATHDDALLLLNCAYATGYRSPYLLEALASIFRDRGDRARTVQWISLAKQTAPDDVTIHVSHSMDTTGVPPQEDQRGGDDRFPELTELLRELEDHARYVIREIQSLNDLIGDVEDDAEIKQYRDELVRISIDYIGQTITLMREALARVRGADGEYRRMVGQPGGGGYNQVGADAYLRAQYNSTLILFIQHYYAYSEMLIRFHSGMHVDTPGFHAVFWGKVLRSRPELLMREQKLEMNPQDVIVDGRKARWNSLDHAHWLRYQVAWLASDRTATDEIRNCPAAEGSNPCIIRAYAAHCQRVIEAFHAMVDAVAPRYEGSAHNFEHVAEEIMGWGEQHLAAFNDYANRCFAKFKRPPADQARMMAAQGMDEMKMWAESINSTAWKNLVETVIDPDHPTHSLAKMIHDQAVWFARDRERAMEQFANEKRDIDSGARASPYGGCDAVREQYLELLAEEAWQEYLNELRNNLASDFQVGYRANFHCDGSLGPLSLSIDESAKGTGTFKIKNGLAEGIDEKIKISMKGRKFTGASIGGGTSANQRGLAGSTDVNVFVEKNSRTGKWDGGIAASGKLGLGLKFEKKMFGMKVGLGFACYPGSVNFKVYGRAAFDDAVALVVAQAKGRPQ